jgi:hypothetical protein
MAETFTPRSSSFIAQIEFDSDEDGDAMTITFTDGAAFLYRGVSPSTYRNMCLDPSPGKFFHRHIKDQYDFEPV